MKSSPHRWSSALVTGASAGIGQAMAEQLGAAGIPTVIVARRAERLAELATVYTCLEPLQADLLTVEGLEVVAQRLRLATRPIDLLVNNAGFGASGNVADVQPSILQDIITLNISALTALTTAALPGMLARKRGWILQVSSVASFQPGPGAAVYSASKAYVTSFSEALSLELTGTGVTVTALCPGFTRSEFHSVSGSAGKNGRIPKSAWMSAADVAGAGLRATAAGKAVEVPGIGYKVLASISNVLPRTLVRRIIDIANGPD